MKVYEMSNSRRYLLQLSSLALIGSLPGCTRYFNRETSPTNPRELRADTDRPIIDGKPSVTDEWGRHATVVTDEADLERFDQNVLGTLGVKDWEPIDFRRQFVSVASVVLPAKVSLGFETVELRGNECRYEFRVDANESTDPDLPDPYVFNVIDLWELNGHRKPTGAAIHVVEVDEN